VTLAVMKMAPLVLLVVVGLFAMSGSNLEWTSLPRLADVGEAAVLLFFAFMGAEAALTASGEVVNPARTVPRAIFLALTLVATLYIGLQVVAQGVLGDRLSGSPAPLVATATAVFGPWGTRLLLLTTMLSVAGFLSADMLCSPRNLHAMAQHGQLPQALATIQPRFKTPAVAVTTYAVVCAFMAWSGSFRQLVILSASGTLLLYLICCVAILRLRARGVATAGRPFCVPGGPTVPAIASGTMVWMLSTLAWTELAAAALLVIVSGLAYGLQERWKR
jgi:basic amino acid/polyamine antiporter, APA family